MTGGVFTRGASGTLIAAGATVPLGETVHRFGCGVARNGDSVAVAGGPRGRWYSVTGTVTLTPASSGVATLSVVSGGAAIAPPSARVAPGSQLTLPVSCMARAGCDAATLSLSLGGVAATVDAVDLVVTCVS